MKVKFNRKKPRQPLFSIIYRLAKLPFASKIWKLKLFLNLNWIFWRLSMEQAVKLYGFSDEAMRRKNLQLLLSKLDSNSKVMDLGCKYGDISKIVAEKVKLIVGIDHDISALEIAKKENKADNLKFEYADAFDYLKSNDENFDVLILSHILEHLEKPEELLANFKEHFTHFYIEVPDFDDTYLNHYRYKVGSSLIYTDDDHIWEFDRDDFTAILENSGLEIIEAEYRYGLQKYWCKKKV
ncbi:MAG: class I SAM-dependent methyltransferase [Chitinophagales bacterium]